VPTSPIVLVGAGGTYSCVSGRLVMLAKGPWVLDLDISADSLTVQPLPSGKVVVTFGGVPMNGTVDAKTSGSFGPTGKVRVIGGGNGWSTAPKIPQDFHSDTGLTTTVVYTAVGGSVGEVLEDDAPKVLGTDFIVSTAYPASMIFGDDPWYVDLVGVTHHGPRPPAVPDPSLVLREFDPVMQKVTFSCDTVLLPGTPVVDPYGRFGTQTLVVQNVEQTFDGAGSVGSAWCGPPSLPGISAGPASLIADDLKAATLVWTRAGFLRSYRYRLTVYSGPAPTGGPNRMQLQAVTPTPGIPFLIPITPWSGVAGVVSTLAPGQEVLVTFENADPTIPHVVCYSTASTDGTPLGRPLKTTMDAVTELDIGPTCLVTNVGATGLVNLAGGAGALVLAVPYGLALAALETFAHSLGAATSIGQIAAAGTALASALHALPTPATIKTKAT
jgi:hypothetical protein